MKNKILSNTIKVLIVGTLALLSLNTASARTLSIGSTGNDVVTLQTFLIDNGYPIPLIESGRASKGYFGTQTQTAVMIYQEDKGQDVTGSIDSTSFSTPRQTFGSVTGPDSFYPEYNFNGQKLAPRGSLLVASSTLCAFRSPTDATSTLVTGLFNLAQSTTTAGVYVWAKSNTQFATTTQLATTTIAANAQGNLSALATTTIIAGAFNSSLMTVADRTFSPGQWLVLSGTPTAAQTGLTIYGVAGTGAPLGGSCSALFAK